MRSGVYVLFGDAGGTRMLSACQAFVRGIRELYSSVHAKSATFVVALVLSSLVAAGDGQLGIRNNGRPANENSGHAGETAHEPSDTLGRNTPHGTLLGFLQAAQLGRYKDAAQYLQLSNMERDAHGEDLARQLHQLMDKAFVGRIGAVSDNPEGSSQPGVPQSRERIGEFRVNDTETNVDLVHVSDPTTGGVIWLFSSSTLARVPELSSQIEESEIESELPRFLVVQRVFGTSLWRWVAFLLFIPLALGISWAMVRLLRTGIRFWLRRQCRPVLQDFYDSFGAPARFILTILFHWVGVIFLNPPLLFREYYRRCVGVMLTAGVAWLVVRVINRWSERARTSALAGSGYRSGSIILLGQRILNLAIVIVAALIVLSILGFNLTTAMAGLGIGSVAIAFAAQKTLENLLGGISILGDEVIRVGELCRIDGKVGTVEDISLRSTRIRTLDSTELSVPNGKLANMNIENLSRYDKNSFWTEIGLQRGTSPDQLRTLIESIRELLSSHPKVDPIGARVRLVGFGESSLDVEIYCHVLTGKWPEFLAIREELLLQIMDLIADAGTELSIPARTLYMAHEQASGEQRPSEIERNTSQRRAS